VQGTVRYMAMVWFPIFRVLCPFVFAVVIRAETSEDFQMILIWFCMLLELKYEYYGELQITFEGKRHLKLSNCLDFSVNSANRVNGLSRFLAM